MAITLQRVASAISMPAAISSRGLPSPTRVMTSDSAKTVHWAVMGITFLALRDSLLNSGRLSSKERAMASKKRPVPAAHLSFMAKFFTVPSV